MKSKIPCKIIQKYMTCLVVIMITACSLGRLCAAETELSTIEITGIQWVQGTWKQRKMTQERYYSGDVIFLKMRFADAEDQPTKTRGTVVMTLKYPGKQTLTIKRTINTKAWRIDANRITGDNADPSILAYDKDTEEVLVGIVRLKQDMVFDYSMKIVFKGKNHRTWQWTDLEDPWEAEKSEPEKP